MEEFGKGEFIFWGTLWGIVIIASGVFSYCIFSLAQSFLKILI
jgi:hypothetical protein